jgi:GTP-binding protein EngB required for normal cell division
VESTVQHVTHGVAEQVVGTIFPQHTNTGPTGPSIQEQIDQAKAEQERLQAAYDQLKQQIEQSEHTEPEIDLDNQTRVTTEMLYKLARQVVPLDLPGRNIGLFGVTATGKSSTVNALLGSKVAGTSVGEATKEINAYDGQNYRLYDFPGQNDELSYFNKEKIALIKGLTHRLVLITATVKEVKKLLNMFEAIDLHYDVIINKFDAIDFEERTALREQINEEIKESQLKNIDHVWCISAKYPEQFPDWLQMVNYLTE